MQSSSATGSGEARVVKAKRGDAREGSGSLAGHEAKVLTYANEDEVQEELLPARVQLGLRIAPQMAHDRYLVQRHAEERLGPVVVVATMAVSMAVLVAAVQGLPPLFVGLCESREPASEAKIARLESPARSLATQPEEHQEGAQGTAAR